MQHFDTMGEAVTQSMIDDAYSHDEFTLSRADIEALQQGKTLYHNFDGKSCILSVERL